METILCLAILALVGINIIQDEQIKRLERRVDEVIRDIDYRELMESIDKLAKTMRSNR